MMTTMRTQMLYNTLVEIYVFLNEIYKERYVHHVSSMYESYIIKLVRFIEQINKNIYNKRMKWYQKLILKTLSLLQVKGPT